jgi:hypothetical protein
LEDLCDIRDKVDRNKLTELVILSLTYVASLVCFFKIRTQRRVQGYESKIVPSTVTDGSMATSQTMINIVGNCDSKVEI